MAQDDRQSIEKALDAHFGTDVARRLGHLSLHPHSDLSVSRVCTNVGVFLNALRQWSFDFNDPENHISEEARDLIHKLKTSAGHLLEVLDALVRQVTDWHAKYKTGEPVGEDGVFPLARKVKSTFDTPRVKSVLAELQYLEVTVNLINDVVKCAALQTAQMESQSGRRTEADRRDVLRAKLYIRSVIMSHRVAQKYVQQRHAEEEMLWNEAQNEGFVPRGENLPPRVDLRGDSLPYLHEPIDYKDDHEGAEQQNQLVDLLLEQWADFAPNVASAEGTEIDMEGDEQATRATEQYQERQTYGPLPFRAPYPARTGSAPVAQTPAPPPAQRPGPPPPRARQPSLTVDTSHVPRVSQNSSAVSGPITYWSIVIGQKHYLFENGERKSDLDIPDIALEARVFSHDNACTEIPKDLVSQDAIRAKGYAHVEVPAARNRAMWNIRTALHWEQVNELIQLTRQMQSPSSSKPPPSALNPGPNSRYVTPDSRTNPHPPFGSRPFEATRLGPIQGSPPVPNTGYPPAQGPAISPSDDRRQRPQSFEGPSGQQRIIAQPPAGYVQRQPSDHNPPSHYQQQQYQQQQWQPQRPPPQQEPLRPILRQSRTTGETGGYGYTEPTRQPPPAPFNTSLVRQPRQGQQAPPPPYSSRDHGRDHGRSNRRRDPSTESDSSDYDDEPRRRRGNSRGRNAIRDVDDDRDYERDHQRIRRLEAANKVAMAKDEQKTRDKRNRSAFAKTWGLVASGAALLEGLDAAF